MVLTVVLALKHCLHSFLKQSDSLSTSLCPLSLVPLFFFAPACQLESLGRVLSISPTSPSCMSSHRWGKLSINRVGPPRLRSAPHFISQNDLQESTTTPLTSLQGQLLSRSFSPYDEYAELQLFLYFCIFSWSCPLAVRSHCSVIRPVKSI